MVRDEGVRRKELTRHQMSRFIFFVFFLPSALAYGAADAGEPDPARLQENSLQLQPYAHCDGFADGIRAVTLDRRPQTADPWREAGFGGQSQRVSVVDGYRVGYSYPRKFGFASLRAERSDPSKYARDRKTVTLILAEMAKADGSADLVEFSDRGFSGQTLSKRELSGSTLAMTQIFSDEDSVIVTIYFHNQVPEMRNFKTYEEFISLRERFIRGYIECVARTRTASR